MEAAARLLGGTALLPYIFSQLVGMASSCFLFHSPLYLALFSPLGLSFPVALPVRNRSLSDPLCSC